MRRTSPRAHRAGGGAERPRPRRAQAPQECSFQAGIQSGNLIKIKGAGVPHIQKPSHRGDHILVVNVKVPTKLTDEERSLYKRLYEINTGKKAQDTLKEKVKGVFQ